MDAMVISLIFSQQDCKGRIRAREKQIAQRAVIISKLNSCAFPFASTTLLISCVQNLTLNLGVYMSVRMPISPSRKLVLNELGYLSGEKPFFLMATYKMVAIVVTSYKNW